MSALHWAATVALDATFAWLVAAALVTAFPGHAWPLRATDIARSRLPPIVRVAAVAALCAAAIDLVLRSLEMADAPLSAAPRVLPAVLANTRIGHLWLVEVVAIAIVGATLGRWRWPALVALVCWAAGRSAVSHAAADGTVWPIAVQVVHALAMGAWSGSVWLAAAGVWWPTGETEIGRTERAAAANRLSALATWALAIVLVSGVVAARRHVGSVAALTASDAYAGWLRMKLVCVAAAALLGAVNRWHALPPLRAGWRRADRRVGRWERRFRTVACVESLALFAAIVVAAKLASTEPPGGG